MVDHKQLLSKYIKHVVECEGVSFLRGIDRSGCGNEVVFTDEEWEELVRLDDA